MKVVHQGIDLRDSGSKLTVAPLSQGYKWRDLKHISGAAALWGNMFFKGTGEKWFLNNLKAFNFHYGPEQRLRFYKLYPKKWDVHTVEQLARSWVSWPTTSLYLRITVVQLCGNLFLLTGIGPCQLLNSVMHKPPRVRVHVEIPEER